MVIFISHEKFTIELNFGMLAGGDFKRRENFGNSFIRFLFDAAN